MAFDNFGDFLAMGKHGFYVWLAYGLTFVVMGGLAWHSLAAHGRTRRELVAQRLRAASAHSQSAHSLTATEVDQ